MAARATAGGEHGGAAAEGEAKLASAKTRSDYEHAVKRLEGMNLNLKLRVATAPVCGCYSCCCRRHGTSKTN